MGKNKQSDATAEQLLVGLLSLPQNVIDKVIEGEGSVKSVIEKVAEALRMVDNTGTPTKHALMGCLRLWDHRQTARMSQASAGKDVEIWLKVSGARNRQMEKNIIRENEW